MYGKLKFESGIHRVQVFSTCISIAFSIIYHCEMIIETILFLGQRVPVTEKSGRVHTSAVSVAILPQADEVPTLLA